MVFSVISMAEATGQTVAIAEVVGKDIDVRNDVPKTIRGDAIISLIGACLGTSLIITSGGKWQVLTVATAGLQSRFNSQWTLVMAATTVAIVPLIALFVVFQRHIVRSIVVTGLK